MMMGDDKGKWPAKIRGVEWDENKRLRILRERGIDFEDAAKILLGRVYEYRSENIDPTVGTKRGS